MNDDTHATTEAPAATGSAPEEWEPTGPPYFGIDHSGPPLEVAAAVAFKAEYFDLLAHAAAHPDQPRWWAAYYGGQRIGLSSDHLALVTECAAKYPDRLFRVYTIDPIFQYPTEFVC